MIISLDEKTSIIVHAKSQIKSVLDIKILEQNLAKNVFSFFDGNQLIQTQAALTEIYCNRIWKNKF